MLELPSPKFQFQLVGVLIEVSVNATVSGAAPELGVPTKLATGGAVTVTYPVFRVLVYPPALYTCSDTLKIAPVV